MPRVPMLLVSMPKTHPILLLDDVLADGGERGPLAVVESLGGALLVALELAHLTAVAVARHTCGHTRPGVSSAAADANQLTVSIY